MSTVQERFTATPMGVNAVATFGGYSIGGFLAQTSGTLTVTDQSGNTLLPIVAVTAGIFTPMPFAFSNISGGFKVALAGGASGIMAT